MDKRPAQSVAVVFFLVGDLVGGDESNIFVVSMSQLSATLEKSKSAWIISPTWDLAYLVATPIVIVPAVWAIARWLVTPEHLYLIVISFASMGHHLPGFMRCYGDRELFARFKWRFLLVPPLFAATGFYFTWFGLHGLALLILLWATWHGLMQTYGFLRIYDLKRGVRDAWSARLDFWLCLSIFWAGLVFSDGRVSHLVELLWKTGTPALDAAWLVPIRWVTGCAFGAVLVLYVFNLWRTSQAWHSVSWAKVLLATTTGATYWITGVVTTDIIIGVAIFEIFHAVQYYAIVWTYNRRLAERVGQRFGPLGFLFQDRWVFLGIYLAAIFAFGSINYFGGAIQNDYLKLTLKVGIITSTLLHYYYDGFIWKVRERKTQVNLDIQAPIESTDRSTDRPAEKYSRRLTTSGWAHAGKFAVLYSFLIGLIIVEARHEQPPVNDNHGMANYLSMWTPNLPEAQVYAADDALSRGDTREAIRLASEIVKHRPRMTLGYDLLGEALIRDQQYADALPHLQASIALDPHRWKPHFNLARAFEGVGQFDRMDAEITLATKLAPNDAGLRHEVAQLYFQRNQIEIALPNFVRAVELDPNSMAYRNALITAYAILGSRYMNEEKDAEAERVYRAQLELLPDSPEANYNLGFALYRQMKDEQAIAAYRRAIELKPDFADCHYNLGLLFLEVGKINEARDSIIQARKFGLRPSPEILQQLGLD